MDYSVQRAILDAIKSDDLESFAEYSEGRGTFRMGRFPLLSIIYLYDAQKIAKKYESAFMKYNNWEELPELSELPSKFASAAGRALSLYFDEVVTPIEMLLILNKRDKVKAHYALTNVSVAQKNRLKAIYYKRYSLEITFNGNEIIIPRPPLTYAAKQRLILSIIASVLSVAIIVCTPFVVNVFYPFIGVNNNNNQTEPDNPDVPDVPTDEPQTYEVSSVDEVDFASKNTYVFTNDVTIPSGFTVEQVFCTIDGSDKVVTFTPGQTIFKEFYGTLKDVTFRGSGDITVGSDYAFVIGDNYGTVNNVNLEYSGKITVDGRTDEKSTLIGGIAVKNTYTTGNGSTQYVGNVDGATVVIDAQIVADRTADASFGSVANANSSTIANCTVSGSITAENCDVGGVCADNTYYLNKNVNQANISQTTSDYHWSPLCAGITLRNTVSYYIPVIAECENFGDITVRSTYNSTDPFEENHAFYQVEGAGIVCNNVGGRITNGINYGTITAESVECVAYAAGICAASSAKTSSPVISSCVNNGNISVHNVEISALAGGICGVAQSTSFSDCSNSAIISQTVDNCTYDDAYTAIGGLVANGNGSTFLRCNNTGKVTANNVVESTYAGGIAGIASAMQACSNTATIEINADSDVLSVGGIAGLANNNASYHKNEGNITVENLSGLTYIGGVIGSSVYTVSFSYSHGQVNAECHQAYVGGILGFADVTDNSYYVYFGGVNACVSDSDLSVTASDHAYVGGVCGFVMDKTYNEGESNESFFGGSVKDCFATSSVNGNANCTLGAISGVVGQKIYNDNSTATTKRFAGDYYLTDAVPAFGGAISGTTVLPVPDFDETVHTDLATITDNETYKAIMQNLEIE